MRVKRFTSYYTFIRDITSQKNRIEKLLSYKRAIWVKARPYYEPLFLILDGLCPDAERRYWKGCCEAQGNNSNTEADTGQMSTGVEIQLPMSHNFLTKTAEQVK